MFFEAKGGISTSGWKGLTFMMILRERINRWSLKQRPVNSFFVY